jgi:hypothetical protein
MLCIFTVAMMGSLGDPKMRLPRGKKKKMIATQAEFRSLQTQVHGVRPVCHRVFLGGRSQEELVNGDYDEHDERHLIGTIKAEWRCVKLYSGTW